MHINSPIGLLLQLYLDLIIILNGDAKCIENWVVWDGHGSLKVINTVDTDMPRNYQFVVVHPRLSSSIRR